MADFSQSSRAHNTKLALMSVIVVTQFQGFNLGVVIA